MVDNVFDLLFAFWWIIFAIGIGIITSLVIDVINWFRKERRQGWKILKRW